MNRRSFVSSSIALGVLAGFASQPIVGSFLQEVGINRTDRNDRSSQAKPKGIKKVTMSDEEWKRILTPDQYAVTRQKGTEPPFTSPLNHIHQQGTFVCVGCALPLFSSKAKFDSGTGWPSFYEPIAKENVHEEVDRSLSESRTEVMCARCDAHLGHVFPDGPKPTGLRYCMNGVALKFERHKKSS